MYKTMASRRPETSVLRDFGGGLNAIDDDISMSTRFQKGLVNMRRTASGAQATRYGTKFVFDIALEANSTILDGVWFNGRHVVVTVDGRVVTATEAGVLETIWDSTIAAALPGAPSGWSTGLTSVDFVPFKNEMVIHNGVDKPITISSLFVVTYLQDLATGSNTNVPIGRYGCVVSNYHVVAGIDADPTSIVISSKGTAGVFPGDAPPNDSVAIDIGAYTSEDTRAIRGIIGYRTLLVVFFATQSLLIQLGTYNADDEHEPEFNDTLPKFGLLGHRCILPIENDVVFADFDNVNKLSRSIQSGLSTSEHLSELISPHLASHIDELTETQRLYETFMVEDALGREIWLKLDEHVHSNQTREKPRYSAWSHYHDLDYQAGWTSLLGRVFLADGTRVYQYGNGTFSGENYEADKMNDQDSVWNTSTNYVTDDKVYDSIIDKSYVCLVGHTSAATGTFEEDRTLRPQLWEEYLGEPIDFEMELPWIAGNDPMQTKHLRHLAAQTKGAASFTISAYVDNLYKDDDGTIIHDPAVQMAFVGNDQVGFGYDSEGFGGGRRSGDPRAYGFPVRFKMIKFIITGSSRSSLQLISLMFRFTRGSLQRP